MTYQTGHIKRNPENGAAAIRTRWPDNGVGLSGMMWSVATVDSGIHNAATADVEDWEDVYVPPAVDGNA